MSLEGRLQRFWLEDVLLQLKIERQTGILTIHWANDIIAISFLEGQVVFADALNDSAEEGLAEALVQAEVVSSEEVEILVSESQADGDRFVDLVVEKGHASREQVLEALRRQCFTLLLELAQLTAGDFKFYSGQEVLFEEGFVPIPVAEFLIRCAWELGESGPLPQPVPVVAAVPQRRDLDSTVSPDSFSDELAAVWDLIDGRTTAAEIAAQVDLSEYDVCLALYQGLQAGHLELVETGVLTDGEVAETEEGGQDKDDRELDLADRIGLAIERWMAWAAALAILLLAVGLTVWLHASPVHFVCPLPWEGAQRGRLVQGRRELLYLRIDNAAKTFYLVEKRFPENLQVLVDSGLLSGADLVEPEGYDLDFISTETGYVVQPLNYGRPLAEIGRTDGVAGNFLLDSRYLSHPAEPAEAPLVLLD